MIRCRSKAPTPPKKLHLDATTSAYRGLPNTFSKKNAARSTIYIRIGARCVKEVGKIDVSRGPYEGPPHSKSEEGNWGRW